MFNKLEKKSLEKLQVALKSDKLYAFLLGIGIYELDAGNMNSSMILNTGAIMNTIYSYCNKFKNISNEVQQSMEQIANIKTFHAVYSTLEIVTYQLSAEKNNKAPFKLDNEKILNILRENINKNLDLYSKSGELGVYNLEKGMIPIVKDYDNELNENYGKHVL